MVCSTSRASITAFSETLQNIESFCRSFAIERPFRPANQHLRLQTDLAQLGDALLSRFCLQFARRLDVRNERDVHVEHILRADFEDELPDRFQKRQTLDVAGGAADLGNDDVVFAFSEISRIRSLITSVTCGMTCTVLPR